MTTCSQIGWMLLACVVLGPSTASADGFLSSLFKRDSSNQTANQSMIQRQSGARPESSKIQLTAAEQRPQARATPTGPVSSTYSERHRFPFPSSISTSDYANRKVISRLMPPSLRRIRQVSRESVVPAPELPQPFPRVAQADDNVDKKPMPDNNQLTDDDGKDADPADTDSDSSNDDDDDESDTLKFDRSRGIGQIKPTLDYAFEEIDRAELPADNDAGFTEGVYQARQMPARNVHWAASNLHHNPLYFEDPALERYGHTHNKWIQPFASSGRMVVQTVGLPYQMAMDPPWTCRSTLGWYRPGECAPRLKYRIPVNSKGTAAEVISIVALLLIIP